jgi:hypothetical protein
MIVVLSSCGLDTPPTAAPAQPYPPVVLVHGYKGNPLNVNPNATPCPTTPVPSEIDLTDFDGLEEQLASIGYPSDKIERVGLISSTCYTPPVADNVPLLKAKIDEVKKKNNASKVILICHSLGGLVGRLYVEGTSYDNDVSYLITIGTPHVGINLSSDMLRAFLGAELMKAYAVKDNQPVIQDLLVGAMHGEAPTRKPDVHYVVIDGRPQPQFFPRLSATGILVKFLAGAGDIDGLVPSDSGRLLAMEDGRTRIDVRTTGDAHSSGLGSPDYFVNKSDSETVRVLKDILKNVATATALPNTPTTQANEPPVTPLPVTPQPPCDTDKFLDLLKGAEDELGKRLPNIAGLYAGECEEANITPFGLVQAAVNKSISLNIRSIHRSANSGNTGLLVTAQARTDLSAGVLENGQIVEDIPGSRVFQTNEAIYVLYPAVEVTTIITHTGPGTVMVNYQFVTGNNPQTFASDRRELEVGADEIALISTGKAPVVEFRNRLTNQVNRRDLLQDLPEIRNFDDRLRPQEVIDQPPGLPKDEDTYYLPVDLPSDFQP